MRGVGNKFRFYPLKRLFFWRPGANETDQIAQDCRLRYSYSLFAGRNLRVHFCLVKAEGVIRIETAAATHIACLTNQSNLTLNDLSLSTIKEEGISAKLVLTNGFQIELYRT